MEGDVEKHKKAAVKGRMDLDLQPKKDKGNSFELFQASCEV